MNTRFHKWLLLLLPLIWIGSSAHTEGPEAHPFYVSVTEINHNAAEKSIEISAKIFIDDMENTLKQQFRTVVDLSKPEQEKRSGEFIDKYVQQHLQLKADGRVVPLKYVGFEKDSESVFCYFEGTGVASVKKLEVVNSLLYDFTEDQINIMHVIVGGKRQSTKLNFPARNAAFQY